MNEVYVALMFNTEDFYYEFSCFSTKEKALDYLAIVLREHYEYGEEDCDYMDNESIDELIEEMKNEIEINGEWLDKADYTMYIIKKEEIRNE